MTTRGYIRSALEQKLATVPGLPSAAYRAWEAIEFAPTEGQPYVKVAFDVKSIRPAVRGSNPQKRWDGYFHVGIVYPTGSGPFQADDLADAVCEAFTVNTVLTESGVNVRFEYAESGQGMTEGPWYIVPVVIRWYSYRT